MIVTENFVTLNFSKTESSSVHKVIKSIFLERRNEIFL